VVINGLALCAGGGGMILDPCCGSKMMWFAGVLVSFVQSWTGMNLYLAFALAGIIGSPAMFPPGWRGD